MSTTKTKKKQFLQGNINPDVILSLAETIRGIRAANQGLQGVGQKHHHTLFARGLEEPPRFLPPP